MNKYSVDDILDELKNSTDEKKPTHIEMSAVDALIEALLREKSDNEKKLNDPNVTATEKEQVKKEIERITATFTKQFDVVKNKIAPKVPADKHRVSAIIYEPDEQPTSKDDKPAEQDTQCIDAKSIHKDDKPAEQDTQCIDAKSIHKDDKPAEQDTQCIDAKSIPKDDKPAEQDSQYIDAKSIPKDDKPNVNKLQDTNQTLTDVTPYAKLRQDRKKAINEFVLEDKYNTQNQNNSAENITDSQEINNSPITDTDNTIINDIHLTDNKDQTDSNTDENPIQDNDEDAFEYMDYSQTEEVYGNLKKIYSHIKISTIITGVLAILGIILSFFTSSGGQMNILGIPLDTFTFAVTNFILLLAGTLICYNVIVEGFSMYFKNKPEKDTLLAFTLILGIFVNGIFLIFPQKLLDDGVSLFSGLLLIILFLNQFSKLLSMNKNIANFKLVSSDGDKYSVSLLNNVANILSLSKGMKITNPFIAKNTKVDFLCDYIDTSFKYDASDLSSRRIMYIGGAISFSLTIMAYFITKSDFVTLSVLIGTLVCCISFIAPLLVAYPSYRATKITNKFGGMVAHNETIDDYTYTDALLIDAYYLFPKDTITLYGIKTFTEGRIDDAIIDAASIVCKSNSVLSHIFMNVINNKETILKPVDSIAYEDSMGISAWVDNKRVLIGNNELMRNHGIDAPSKDYEEKYLSKGHDLIYLATASVLRAVFVVGIGTNSLVVNSLNMAEKNNITLIVKTVDPFLDEEKLSNILGIEKDLIKVLPSHLHKDYDDEIAPKKTGSCAVCNNGSIFAYILSLVATKKLSAAVKFGKAIYFTGVFFALLMYTIAIITNTVSQLGSVQILAFSVLWTLIYYLSQKFIRF